MANLRWRRSINDELRGKLQELKGRLTGSRTEVMKGRARRAVGEFQYGPSRMREDFRSRRSR